MKRLVAALIYIFVIVVVLIPKTIEASASSINQKTVVPERKISAMDRLLKFSTIKNYLNPAPAPKQEFVMPRLEYNNRVNSLLLLPKNESFTDVQAYNLSPDKKLLFIETTGSGLKSRFLTPVAKKIVREKYIPGINVTDIVDTQTGKQIATFENVITYRFSPDQTMLLIINAVQKTILKTKNAETLQGNLIDTMSKSIVKTLDNIQAADFTPDNKLVVRYGNSIEKMDIKDIKPISTVRKFLNYLAPRFFAPKKVTEVLSLQDQKLLQKIKYDLPSRTLTITPTPPWRPTSWPKITSYSFDLNNQFVLAKSQFLFRVPGGFNDVFQLALEQGVEKLTGRKNKVDFLSMKTGKLLREFPDVISYEFNLTDQAPPRLLIFNINTNTKKPCYQLIDLEGDIIKTFENAATAYFDFTGNLVVIDQKGKTTLYDAIKGMTETEKGVQAEREYREGQRKKELSEELPDTLKAELEKQKNPVQQESLRKQFVRIGTTKELMTAFDKSADNSVRANLVTEISEKLMRVTEDERSDLLASYNEYNKKEKQQFAELFFIPPFKQIVDAGTVYSACGDDFCAHVANNQLTITDQKDFTNILFPATRLGGDFSTIAFDPRGKYVAIGYTNKKGIDIFYQSPDKKFTYAGIIMPDVAKDFSNIIGVRFITTALYNTYLFFIDKNYNMGIMKIDAKMLAQAKPEPYSEEQEKELKLDQAEQEAAQEAAQESYRRAEQLKQEERARQREIEKRQQEIYEGMPEELRKNLESQQKAKEEPTLGQQRAKEKQQEQPEERAELPALTEEEIAELTEQYKARKGSASLQKKSLEEYLQIAQEKKAELLRLREENREKELPQIQEPFVAQPEPLVEQPAQEPQRLPEAQFEKKEAQPEVVELPKIQEPLVEQRAQALEMTEAQKQPEEEEALPRKTLPRIEEPSIEKRGQTLPMPEVQKQPEPQKQPERASTTIQNLMNRFSTVYQELPDGLGSLEDIDKAKAINAQLEQIVTQMAKELTIGNGNEWPDFFESYNKFNMMEKRKFAKIFFASPEGSFGADKQTYSVQSKDYQYRADRVSNERGIELSVSAKSGDDWLPAGKIVPNEPKEFANIIGFRFITGDPRYSLLFIDKNYDIGVINVAWEVAKLEKPKQKKLVMLF